MLVFERDIAIDLGTNTTLLYAQGKGIVLREPTVVAVDKHTGELLKVGQEAQKMLGRTPANIVAIHPIRNGVISDYDMTVAMLSEFVKKVTSISLFKPRMLVSVPGYITGVEERALIDAVVEAGARKVYLSESTLATATGAGIDIYKPDGNMVVDIGAGKTDIAVVSLGGVVESRCIKTAGNAFDEAIVRYIKNKHNVVIGMQTAEELKRTIGGIVRRDSAGVEDVKGRCLATGMPKTVSVNSAELAEVMIEPTKKILDAIHAVLERTPPELVGDIGKNGIRMSGGGSMLYGLDRVISKNTGIPAVVVDDALTCTAFGAGRMMAKLDDMEDGMINIARKRQLKG